MNDVYHVVDAYLLETNANIFLVTEDRSIKKQIVERYGERVKVVSDDVYAEHYKEGHMLADTIDKAQSYHEAVIYEKKIVLLSRCKYLIAAKTNGSLMALIMNAGKYEKVHVFEDGMYE